MQPSRSEAKELKCEPSIPFWLAVSMCVIITFGGVCFVTATPINTLKLCIEGMIITSFREGGDALNVNHTKSILALIRIIGGLLLVYGSTNLVYAFLYVWNYNKTINNLNNTNETSHQNDQSYYFGKFYYFARSNFFVYQTAWGIALFCSGISFSSIRTYNPTTSNDNDKNKKSSLILVGVVWTLISIMGIYLEGLYKPKNYPEEEKSYPQIDNNEQVYLLSKLNATKKEVKGKNNIFYDHQLKPEKVDEDIENKDMNRGDDGPRVKGPRRLLQLARSQSFCLITGCIALLVRLPFSLAIPHLISVTLGALSKSDYEASRTAILQLIICALIDGIFDFVCVFLYGYANLSIVKNVRLKTFKTLLSQEMAFFDTQTSGSLASRLTADCGQMGSDLTWFFRFSVESVFRIFGIITYMLVRCPTLGFCTVSIVPLVAILNRIYGNWLQENAKSVQDSLAKANSIAQDALSCIRTVIAFASEDLEYGKYDDQMEDNFKLEIHQLIAQGLYYMIVSNFLMNAVVVSSLLFIGMLLIQRGQLTADILLAFMLYQGSLQSEIQNFFNAFTALIRSAGAGDKVFELLDRRIPEPGMGNHGVKNIVRLTQHECDDITVGRNYSKNEIDESKTKGSVTFQNISFAYPSRSHHIILNNLNLEISPGTTMALVGVSGCGKSTIMSLLQRFYEPTSGRILMDGVDLKGLNLKLYRQNIGVVTQDPVLFSGSILSNLTYGCRNSVTTMEDVIHAARQANAHDFIQGFPDKYETQVGERGIQLSGGQKQRIAIARALVKKPTLLLLDEATSALDCEAEKSVQKALDQLLTMNEHMTTIIIAHRLQTIRNADCIAVVDQGRVVELGTHEQLLQNGSCNKIYRKMVQQSSLNDETIIASSDVSVN